MGRNSSSLFVIIALLIALVAGLVWFVERYRSVCQIAPTTIGCGITPLSTAGP